jgi:hypothetical protein
MRASARARSPTSSRRSSCGIVASGPSSVMRSAAVRSRPRRRSSVEESAIASSAAIERPTTAAMRNRLRTWLTRSAASSSSRSATSVPANLPFTVSGVATRTVSPWISVSEPYCPWIAARNVAGGTGENSLSYMKPGGLSPGSLGSNESSRINTRAFVWVLSSSATPNSSNRYWS